MFSQFFVNISTTLKCMCSESVSNSSYGYNVIETSKEVLVGLKMMLNLLSRANVPPVLLFSDKSHTAICFIPLSKKYN